MAIAAQAAGAPHQPREAGGGAGEAAGNDFGQRIVSDECDAAAQACPEPRQGEH